MLLQINVQTFCAPSQQGVCAERVPPTQMKEVLWCLQLSATAMTEAEGEHGLAETY